MENFLGEVEREVCTERALKAATPWRRLSAAVCMSSRKKGCRLAKRLKTRAKLPRQGGKCCRGCCCSVNSCFHSSTKPAGLVYSLERLRFSPWIRIWYS